MVAWLKASISLEMIVGRQEHVITLRPDSDNLQFEKELNEK